MPIIPKNSKIRFILFILFFIVIILAFYFKAKDVSAPIVVPIPTTDDSANASYLDGQMEDGVVFDDSTASTTGTSTATTTTKVKVATSTAVSTTTEAGR